MSAPTVSKAVAALIDVGLLEEFGLPEQATGRPAKLLQLAQQSACVQGVVIDARTCWVMSAGLDGKLYKEQMRSFDTPNTYSGLLSALEYYSRELTKENECLVHGIGISVPGLVNGRLKQVVFSPNLHVLDGHSPAHDLSERLKHNCLMFQESHALCLAERLYGEAKGRDDFAMLDVSTGLGLGVMSGGQLLLGNSGLAGELGHITIDPNGIRCGCGNRGCLETLATDSALARAVSAKLGRTVDIEETVTLIREGKIDATAELDRVAEYLAIAIAAVINIFNPTTLFVHGALFKAGDDLFLQVMERAKQRTLTPSLADCRIIQARGSKRQGAIAGIIHHLTHSWAPSIS